MLWAGLTAGAASDAGAAADAVPGNPLSFFDGGLVFDVQERLRVEVRDNTYDFNSARNASTDDAFLLQRFRLGVTVKPAPWFKAYAQGQDIREIDSKRQNVPFVLGAEGDDPFDLRQGFMEVGNAAEFPLTGKQHGNVLVSIRLLPGAVRLKP